MKIHLMLMLLFAAMTVLAFDPVRLRAVACIDGDTFVGSKDARVVRLWGIDAPELDQPWREVSKAALIALTHRRQLNVEPKGDSWGRLVGVARRGKTDIGLELIKMGLAWHDPRYAPKAKEYAEAEAEAQKEKQGFGATTNPLLRGTGASSRTTTPTKMIERMGILKFS